MIGMYRNDGRYRCESLLSGREVLTGPQVDLSNRDGSQRAKRAAPGGRQCIISRRIRPGCWVLGPVHLLAAVLLLCVTSPAHAKYALLVGVSNYEHPRLNQPQLKYPEDDVKALALELRSAGYEVQELVGKSATRDSVNAAMQRISKRGTSDDVLILGFFGHGVQYGDSAYYCPYDTDLRTAKDDDDNELRDKGGLLLQEPDPATMVSMRDMLDTLTISKTGSRLLLADCCREDPSRARVGLRARAFGEGLQVNQIPGNCAAFFACGAGQQAFEDEDWQHGAFTRALLDTLRSKRDLTANELYPLLYRRVNELISSKPAIAAKQTVSHVTRDLVDLKLGRNRPMAPSLPQTLVNGLGATFRLIPAGSFLMGSPESDPDAYSDEKPQHTVMISRSYYMGETEVTQGQWKAVLGTEPWKGKDNVREGANYPATNLSWEDAVEYCRRLSELEGRTYRLPTEAEWEYACRGVTKTRYSFGDDAGDLSKYGWFEDNASDKGESYAHEVKQKLANPYGLYDIHGNVWEWCSDWYGDYSVGALTDPLGAAGGSYRVSRGGCWDFQASSCRAALRGGSEPSYRDSYLGFRLLLSPSVE